MEERGQGDSIDAVLRQLLGQGLRTGRIDPQAERLAAQGIDRLKAFLGSTPAGGTRTGGQQGTAEDVVDAVAEDAVVEDAAGADVLDEVTAGRPLLRHTIPLADGTRVEVSVPERLTAADVERIARVLAALVVEE
ncbi:hypothetical protein GTQ99_10270 [Kineococcus sp. T13]|uniref:hypothetical protein n=1 Tax=Kineococcus vitellinus TaxID=2696565 RepID=UPI001412B074|nr:hypothetical protein [Kineococcus vitellinus]NAZ75795.1 hypothetical protein [Kineococcus vitellinus]